MAIVGIDLGTTNSAIAYLKDGKPVIIENKLGGRTTPSVFQINTNGEIVIGQEAKDTYPSLTNQTVMEIKRLMGTDQMVEVAGRSFRPEEISAFFIKYLKECAEERLGESVTEAVITVPAYFTDSQRKATKIAGELAGLKVERIINEPTAASLAFGLDYMDKNQYILVYDLGGGTFDVSVVEMFDGVIEVKATAGNNKLGGMDFDLKIVEWIMNKFEEKNGYSLLVNADNQELLKRKALLKETAEKVKKILSSQFTARIHIPFLGIYNQTPISVELEMTRAEFEKLIFDLAESTLESVDEALQSANLKVEDIHEILLIGGSTRIPLIQKLVEDKFKKPSRKSVNPDEAVALGAAIQAGIKAGEVDTKAGLMVIDVCPYTLGTDVIRRVEGNIVTGFFDPIIPKNSIIPISEKKVYQTAYNYQDQVLVSVYQGESEFVENNILLSDDILLDGIPKKPAGQEKIEVTFTYDINGILHVEAKVLSTGQTVKQAIRSQIGVLSKEQVVELREKIENDWKHSELYKDVKSIIYRAEQMIQSTEEKEKDKLEKLLAELKTALKDNDANKVKEIEEQLTDLLIELV